MGSQNMSQSFTEDAALRIDIYSLLAHLLRKAPDAEVIDWLANLDVDAPNALIQTTGMSAAWPLLKLAAQKTLLTAAEDEYQDLFIGIGHGEIVPFGSWFLTGSLMEMPLAHLRHDLKKLGFQRDESVKEPEDHIAALLEVMTMLVSESNHRDQAEFFNRHIDTWFERFCLDLKKAKSAVFYSAVAELAWQFLSIEKIRFIDVKK
ncbi:molecular chaperone [Moritella sp. F3]|uniref:TorD/DmsD family molecular chaperone n=1 Tax=Moritella sp. F3 TaxID=2718882 RepID=UPI0018E0DA16|nr:molecular chaperone TorD family protein [Moritella sp. F3]GIC76458.1 hypothetical protein FMO001_11850 [Moritella sp. F1]GIC80873.1 hypothetical protein FMO003_11540 [Moritella sp. F3]